MAILPNVHPKRYELICIDGTTPIYVHLIEHCVGTELPKSTLEEQSRLIPCNSIASIRVHFPKNILQFLPSLLRQLASYRPLRKRFAHCTYGSCVSELAHATHSSLLRWSIIFITRS